jgi:hypothetical protein
MMSLKHAAEVAAAAAAAAATPAAAKPPRSTSKPSKAGGSSHSSKKKAPARKKKRKHSDSDEDYAGSSADDSNHLSDYEGGSPAPRGSNRRTSTAGAGRSRSASLGAQSQQQHGSPAVPKQADGGAGADGGSGAKAKRVRRASSAAAAAAAAHTWSQPHSLYNLNFDMLALKEALAKGAGEGTPEWIRYVFDCLPCWLHHALLICVSDRLRQLSGYLFSTRGQVRGGWESGRYICLAPHPQPTGKHNNTLCSTLGDVLLALWL